MHTQDGCWEAALNLPVLHIPLCTRTCPLIYCPRSSASEKTHMYHSTLQPLGLTPARGIVSHPWQTQAIQPQFYLLPLSRYFFLSIETYSASIMLRFPNEFPIPSSACDLHNQWSRGHSWSECPALASRFVPAPPMPALFRAGTWLAQHILLLAGVSDPFSLAPLGCATCIVRSLS